MIKEPTYEDLKKQINTLQFELAKVEDERKQAETALDKADLQNYQLRTALGNLNAYVYIKDKQKKYVFANQKTLSLFNCTAQELIGSSDADFFPKETCEQLIKIDERILEHGENTASEIESKDSEGNRLVYWEVKTPIYDVNGENKIVGICGISTDITDRKQKEETIKESAVQLEGLNTTKDKMFSIMAHDLRSPFINIIGVSELLLEMNDTDKATIDTYIDIINATANDSLILLDNLLIWARAQTGEINFRPETINLSNTIRHIIELQKSLAKAKDISIQYAPSTDIKLYTDENILSTIVRNLISNAIKFTNTGGNVQISTEGDEHEVKISITDDGVGMDKKVIDTLFDATKSATLPGTADETGTGFGLLLCKEFVEKLDGTILVESEVGKGSRFIVTLPKNNSKEKL